MSEQALNLRRYAQVVRRHKILISIATVLGFLLGVTYAVLSPPKLTSTALVLLPVAVQNSAEANASPGFDATSFIATQAVIAISNPVLSGALPNVGQAMSLQMLHRDVQAESTTDSILAITATGTTAAQAEAVANAVARSYVGYVASASSPVRTQAYILNPATSATGMGRAEKVLVFGVPGAVVGALVGIIVALVITRRDRRLRMRDEIAAAVGLPVLTAIPVAHPADAASWAKLLEDYQPGPLAELRLRQTLQQLRMVGVSSNNSSSGVGFSLTVLSLLSDPGALALGPQLAVFAASLGIPTALVVGPPQDTTVTAALRTACGALQHGSSKLPDELSVSVPEGSDIDSRSNAVLTIVVAAVDSRAPQLAETIRTTVNVLGVSAGGATAEQLARTVTSAASEGREIEGILVADPEQSDNSFGRIPGIVRVGSGAAGPVSDTHRSANQKLNEQHEATPITQVTDGRSMPSTEIRR
jgi:capsular polysaccharide biosynthesis protein